MQSVSAVIDSLGSIATRQQLIAAGLSGYDLTLAVRRGEVRRVRQARYATAEASFDAMEATRVGGMLAGSSAARSYGLWAGFDTRLHLSVGAHGSRLRTNRAPSFNSPRRLTPDTSNRSVVIHWLERGAVPELGPECWRVTLPSCLKQMVSWSDRENALACLDTARNTLNLVELTAIFREAPIADRLLVADSRRGSDSGPESLVRQRLRRIRVQLRQQISIPGVGRVDAGIVGTRVILEIDSREYHESPEAFERDRWRTAELVARGYIVVQLSYLRITTDWHWCERMVLAAIARS